MRTTFIATASALVLALSTTACASTPSADMNAEAEQAETLIQVENLNPLRVNVRAVSNGDSRRLGSVETAGEEVFALPPTVNEFDLRIQVEPVGSPDRWVSDDLVISQGDLVSISVGANLDLTSVTTS